MKDLMEKYYNVIYYLCNELMRFFSFPTQYIAGGTVY